MADEKPKSAPKKAPELKKAGDSAELEAKNITEETVDRVEMNADKVLKATGKVPENMTTLVKETKDQIETELRAEKSLSADDKVLRQEQRDHQRTLARALGVTDADGVIADEDELRKTATERMKELRSKDRNKEADERVERNPATWNITSNENGKITAKNSVTGREFEGKLADLMKAD